MGSSRKASWLSDGPRRSVPQFPALLQNGGSRDGAARVGEGKGAAPSRVRGEREVGPGLRGCLWVGAVPGDLWGDWRRREAAAVARQGCFSDVLRSERGEKKPQRTNKTSLSKTTGLRAVLWYHPYD